MRKKSARQRVVVVATPDTHLFELAIPCEVFGVDRTDLTAAWYDFELVTAEPGTTTDHGLSVPAGRGLEALRDADLIVVPACDTMHSGAPQTLLGALREAHVRGARIASICSGAFVLAEAGLLDGRRATTHWMHAPEFAGRYPGVLLDPDVLYVHDDVWTSAGSAAALDMCLAIVRADHGAAVANEVARRIVIPPHRDGGQSQFIRPRPAPVGHDLADSLDWARRNLDKVTVTGLAAHAGTSTRTLHRTMTRVTGGSAQDWLLRERIGAAQELLETSDLTMDAIAVRTGLGTGANLRAHFTRSVGTSPSHYRKTFRGASGYSAPAAS